jgi:hypothetical protein
LNEIVLAAAAVNGRYGFRRFASVSLGGAILDADDGSLPLRIYKALVDA